MKASSITYFSLTMGSYFGSKVKIVYDNGMLFYNFSIYADFPDPATTCAVQAEPLKEIENLLPSIQRWKNYYDGNVCDGMCWEVIIKAEGKEIRKGGNQSYPANWGSFIRLTARLCNLDGDRLLKQEIVQA